MPYVYEVSFDIGPEQMSELEVGRSLDRLVGYLKIRLPSEEGFVYAHGVYSVDDAENTHVVMRSEWMDWADLEAHGRSTALEDIAFQEFGPHVKPEDVTVRRYAEVGSGPLAYRT